MRPQAPNASQAGRAGPMGVQAVCHLPWPPAAGTALTSGVEQGRAQQHINNNKLTGGHDRDWRRAFGFCRATRAWPPASPPTNQPAGGGAGAVPLTLTGSSTPSTTCAMPCTEVVVGSGSGTVIGSRAGCGAPLPVLATRPLSSSNRKSSSGGGGSDSSKALVSHPAGAPLLTRQ